MTTGRDPMDRDNRSTPERDDSRRKLAMTLAALAILLVIILFFLFSWWRDEGEETDDEDVTRWTLVSNAHTGDALVRLAA